METNIFGVGLYDCEWTMVVFEGSVLQQKCCVVGRRPYHSNKACVGYLKGWF